jgi:hypothetical protein
MILVPYNISSQTYNVATNVPIAQMCNGFMVKNTGTTIVLLNGTPIQPGDSISVGGNYGEEYRGRLDIGFFTQTPPPFTIINEVTIIQKFYMPGQGYDYKI